jgi:hypothetical protein
MQPIQIESQGLQVGLPPVLGALVVLGTLMAVGALVVVGKGKEGSMVGSSRMPPVLGALVEAAGTVSPRRKALHCSLQLSFPTKLQAVLQ